MKIIPNKFKSFFSNNWYKSPLKLFLGCFFVFPILIALMPYLLINAIKMPKVFKIFGYIFLTLAILVYIGSTAPEESQNPNLSEVGVNSEKPNNTEVTADMNTDFIEYYNQILDLDNAGKAIYNATTEKLKLVTTGEMSEAELFVEYRNAQDQVYENSKKFKAIEVKGSLVELKIELEDIKGRASLAHFAMSESLRLQAEYLNSNDLEKYKQAEEQSQLYSDIMKEVTVRLINVSKQAGVDPMDLRTK